MINQYCPNCTELICPPAGRSQELLIVGEFPGKFEMEQGKPFASSQNFMTAGKILRKELERCGVGLTDFRCINLWLHEPTKDENCFKAGYNNVLDEAKGKKAILLVGSDTVSTFTKYKVSDVSGLQVDSDVLSAPIIYASVNPMLALHRSFGEVRFAIEQFVARLEKEKLI
jgi:uracil-DNA glycosylase